MNNLITIQNVRGYIGKNGIAFLNLEDVARGLGFTQVKNNKEYIRWETLEKYLSEFSQQVGKNEFIPENVFYKLCMKANNEVARKFQDLVCDEILPSIRKDGGYIAAGAEDTDEQIMAKALLVAQRTIQNNNGKIKALELDKQVKLQQIAELQPKGRYYDLVLQCSNLLSVGQIAKDYGKSARWLNEKLHELKVQYKQGNVWLLYQKYADKGYTQTKIQNFSKTDGTQGTKPHIYWTQKGRLFLYDLLKNKGIVPMIEREVI